MADRLMRLTIPRGAVSPVLWLPAVRRVLLVHLPAAACLRAQVSGTEKPAGQVPVDLFAGKGYN